MHHQPGAPSPVFVDRTGRRRRLTVIAGTAMGLGLLTSLGLVAAGLFLDTSVPLPGWSDDRRAPLEAGFDDRNAGRPSPTGARPSTVTSTSAPTPTATRSVAPRNSSAPASTGPAAQPSRSDRPGQGDERRSAKPSKSPGKPR